MAGNLKPSTWARLRLLEAADGLSAATALAYGRRVLTADRAFLRFPGLEVEWVEPLGRGRH